MTRDREQPRQKMKLLVVLTASVALASATQGFGLDQGRVVSNELLRTNRRIFSGSGGGWGSSGAAGGLVSSGYRPGPPPSASLDAGGLMSLFNAMSNFGLSSSSYGPPSSSGSSGVSAGRPNSQYGPPSRPVSGASGGSASRPQYGPPPPSGGSSSSGSGAGGGRPQYGPPGSGASSSPVSGGAGALPVVSTRSRGNAASAGLRNANGGGAAEAAGPDGGRIFRYVSLFTAPDEPAPPRPKVVRAGSLNPDKHVNIIFVKPPSPPAEQPTEVLLAPDPERKTIVYVLMKKPEENQDTVRVRPAPPTQPSKPEVYFIPYKDPSGQPGQGGNQDGGSPGGYSDGPSAPVQGPSGGYSSEAGGPIASGIGGYN